MSKKQLMSYFLCAVLSFSMIPAMDGTAAKKPKLSSKKISVKIKQRKVLKVKNTKKKVRWKVISGKSRISVKRKGKTSFVIRGKKKGTAKIRFTIGKKKLFCKVTVKTAKKNTTKKDKNKPVVIVTKAPMINPDPTNVPTNAPTNVPTNAPTNAPTDVPASVPTNAPADANPQDLAATKALIQSLTKAGSTVQNDLSSSDYKWENGRLTEIHWDSKKLTGDLDVSTLTALKTLLCSGNKLTSLKLSNNTALTELNCADNSLKALNVSDSPNLTKLSCQDNELSNLDISKNVALSELNCSGNPLKNLNVSDNAGLTKLSCGNNSLNSLDVSKNTALAELDCANNSLTALAISENVKLEKLSCQDNKLSSLDISKNAALSELNCSDNPLKTLNVSGNANLTKLSCGNNSLSSLDVSKNTELADLDCANNSITALAISENVKLEKLSCGGNSMNSLDVSKNTALTELDCTGNPLAALDVSKNTALTKLNCSDIASADLDVTKNTALRELSCWGNQWQNLDISQNGHLEKLSCGDNSLSHLDVSKNTALMELSCGGNPLDSLNVSANTALTKLSCDRNSLNALDVSANVKLKELSCNDNVLNCLNVSKNTSLKKLACSCNNLKSLDVTKNTALESLSCKENSLQSLNLKENNKLTNLSQDSSVAVDGYDPLSHMVKTYEISDNMKWWAYGKFGMFIHFGAYSEYGQGEWAMYEQSISKERYQSQIIAGFNPTKFNADEIVKYAKAAGMKYIVITSKHHEGFSMWDTQVESFKDYTGSKTFSLQKFTDFGATGRDVLQELKTACEKEGLKFGLYYSIVDWNHSSQTKGGSLSSIMSSMETRKSYITDMKAQLRELIERYDPAVFWFDGDWTYSDKEPTLQQWWTKSDGIDLYNYMKSLSPNIIVNERVCRGFGLGDFECPERQIPSKNNVPKRAWETCQSMNSAWGYKQSLENSYSSSDKLIQDLTTVASEGGNYLLNIGPKGSGEMTKGSQDILNDFSKWIRVNEESIYNVSPSPFQANPSWGTYTRKGNTVYAHVRNWQEGSTLTTERYDGKQVDSVTILGKSCDLNYRITKKQIIIQMPKNVSNENNLVIAIHYK